MMNVLYDADGIRVICACDGLLIRVFDISLKSESYGIDDQYKSEKRKDLLVNI